MEILWLVQLLLIYLHILFRRPFQKLSVKNERPDIVYKDSLQYGHIGGSNVM